jgi:hypothetical protein
MPHHSSSELVDYPRQSFSARALGKHADSFLNNTEIHLSGRQFLLGSSLVRSLRNCAPRANALLGKHEPRPVKVQDSTDHVEVDKAITLGLNTRAFAVTAAEHESMMESFSGG